MNKARNNYLVMLADEVLQEQEANTQYGVSKILNDGTIESAYNGSVAALSVSIALSDLRPALAIYHQDKPDSATRPKANRRSVLDAIARMITKDIQCQNDFSAGNNYAANFFQEAVRNGDSALKREVIDCAIALKQVVRTYNLV